MAPAVTVICNDLVAVPKVAERIAHPFMVGDEVNGNVVVMEPAETVTEAGRPKPVLVDFKPTTTALAVVEVKVRVQVPPPPGATAVGEQAKRAREDADGGAVIVRVTVLLEPPRVAVTVGVWPEVTAAAVAVKVAAVVAAATVTDAGTVTAEVALLERVTREPPVGAALESVTVQDVVEDAARVVLVH